MGETDGSGAMLRRYVHGPGADEPLVWYEGSGTGDRRWLMADERGSIIAVVSASGTTVNTYDEYGQPGGAIQGRFGYTGQAWIPEAGLYHYKARAYLPSIGRFLQTDPLGYAAGMNLYAYAGNDPVGSTDPSGLNPVSWLFHFLRDLGEQTNGYGYGPGQWCWGNDPQCGGAGDVSEVEVTGNRPGSYHGVMVFDGPGGVGNEHGGGAAGQGPQNRQSAACAAIRSDLYKVGGQIKSFGTALQVGGLGLGVIGLAGSEGGGEVLLPGSVWFVRGGVASSALGASVQAYALGGQNRVTAAAIAAVQTYVQDAAVGGLANAALRAAIGKERTEQVANALGLLSDKLTEVENNCGEGRQ